jgi:hypothetical protein
MSKATFLKSLFGEIAPKAAAPAAGASLMFPSDDAEAGVKLRLLQDAPTVYNSLRKQLARGRGGPLTPVRIAEKILHDKKIANYDSFGPYARKVDGEQSGEYFKGGVQSLYDEILGAVDDPDPSVVAAMDEWAQARLGREAGVSMAENRAKALALRKAGGGAVAAGAAGGANAQDAGFPSWEEYRPEPSIWEKAGDAVMGSLGTALEPWMPGGAVAESAVGKHVYGNVGDVLDLTEIPARAAHGVARGGWGLMNGESLGQAFNHGMGTYNSTIDENAERLSTYVEGRGAHPDDVSAAYWGTLLSDPTNLLGLGITKNAVKGAIR